MVAQTTDVLTAQPPVGYAKPVKSIYTIIDGALPPNMLFQMTVDASEKVDVKGVNAAIRHFGVKEKDPVYFYFVVPQEAVSTFQIGEEEKVTDFSLPVRPPEVRYRVLEVP
jgi:hypothetical protein